ncbi:sensor histidine kinase [Parahaliea maris]|uniref:Sensor histidine kinase n=1 Tax=Parahaliea maris TaxID=2716870 RepID=A0A5C9A061_9GAMM|nr:sensor histidine kinase [Parahaliea maris]TXS94245.1 sensor histidine kinase [Parahaliea maris]
MQPGVTGQTAGHREGRNGGNGAGAPGEFFIPDLCGTRQVFLIVLLAQLLVLVYTLAVSGLPNFHWNLLGEASLFVQWVVLLSTALLCLLRGPFARLGVFAATCGSLLLVLLVTAASTAASSWVYPDLQAGRIDGWNLLRNLLVALVVAGVVLRYFYLQQQLRQREHSELQARVDALRARIRPHFLFNTLNSIVSLIETRPDLAERAVEDLAELFRGSLREATELVTVADEVRLCELYLGIEQLRLGERLQVEWDVEDACRDIPMPSLVLQPLVENAVYHGIARRSEGGCITVAVSCRGGQLQAEVSNPAAVDEGVGGMHIALDNIEQRLHGQYGDDAGLELARDGGEFRVRLHYPCPPCPEPGLAPGAAGVTG